MRWLRSTVEIESSCTHDSRRISRLDRRPSVARRDARREALVGDDVAPQRGKRDRGVDTCGRNASRAPRGGGSDAGSRCAGRQPRARRRLHPAVLARACSARVACTYSAMKPGQLLTLRPSPSTRYQLSQPVQTELRSRSCTCSSKLACTSGRTSSAPPPARARRSASIDVARLRLDHHDDRAEAEVRVRPVEQEHVRKAGDGDAEMGARAALPAPLQVPPAAPVHLQRQHELVRLEAGAVDDAVDLALDAVGGDGAALADALDVLGDQLDVRALQRRQPVRREQDALAAEGIVGPDLLAAARGPRPGRA